MTNPPKRIWIQGNAWHEHRHALAAGGKPVEYILRSEAVMPDVVESLRNCLKAYDDQPSFKSVGAVVMPVTFVEQLLEHFEWLSHIEGAGE